MFLFDLTATTINNYNDHEKEPSDPPVQRQRRCSSRWLYSCSASTLGIYLVLLTDIVVLLAGGLCFFLRVIYS
jgi:1,4-dihydroxy-2-naphthoate octaprenyltransferase